MHPFMYILKLATLKKMPDKKMVLRAAAVEGCTRLFEGFQLAFDKKRVFNVKSAPLITIDETLTQEEIMQTGTYTWDMFKALLNLLEKNELDDDTKKKLLFEAAEEAGVLEWNAFYRPIIMKNLKCGVTAKTINIILDEFGIETIKYKTPIWRIKHLHNNGLSTGKKYVEPLLHGTRAIMVINKDINVVKMYNEKGNIIKKLKIDLEPFHDFMIQFPESLVLDGNIINRDYNNLMNEDIDGSFYAVYDIMLLRDFNQNYCPTPLADRKETLNNLQPFLRKITNGQVFVLPSLLINLDSEEDKKKLEEYKTEMKEAGYKSVVFKSINSAYDCEVGISWHKASI